MKKITIFTHGSAKGNPGPAAIGVLVVDEKGETILELSESIGNATNNYAEYFAVVRGLQAVVEKFGDKTSEIKFELKLTSELVEKQLNGESQIKDVGLVGYFIEIHNLKVSSFPNLTFIQISLDLNQKADQLLKGALDV